MHLESLLEAKVSTVFQANPLIVEIREQYPAVTYLDDQKVERSHTFDLWFKLENGARVAIAVRPLEKLNSGNLTSILELIYKQRALKGQADYVWVCTEYDVDRGQVANARQVLRSRLVRDPDEISFLFEIVCKLIGTFRFVDLLQGVEIQAHRRNAIWCLIDDGVLEPVLPGRIDDLTYLRKTQRQSF